MTTQAVPLQAQGALHPAMGASRTHDRRRPQAPTLWPGWLASALLFVVTPPLSAQSSFEVTGPNPTERIAELERIVDQLQHEVAAMRSPPASLPLPVPDGDAPLPVEWPDGHGHPCCDDSSPSYTVYYDDGWVLRPHAPQQSPFELKFNLHNQFRYTGFANSTESFTDSAGNTHPVPPRSDFDINRGRFVVSGYAFDPQLTFYTNIDYNTVANDSVLLLLSWMSYRFSEALTLSMGLVKVPGTWEWQESSRFTRGSERTMATTFFRPSITAGLWAHGKLAKNLYYDALVGDGFNTFTLRAAELDTNLAYSALVWWEPQGDFGVGFSDLEYHESASLRLGHGFTFAANDADPLGEPGPEQTLVRLSDGTRLVEPGALTPGSTVNAFDLSLYAAHVGWKRKGCSFAAEVFLRWLTSLEGTAPLPVDSLFDHGYFVSGGVFVIPKRLELYALTSHVQGDYGTGTEVGGGFNWFLGGRRGSRFTLDAVHLDDSPAEQNRTGFVAGGSGALIRGQFWHFF